jgi:PAS domain-containing protein
MGWIGSGTDIDDLNRAKEAIQREKEFSERLIDSSVDGIFAFDRDCRYTVWIQDGKATGIGHAQTIGNVLGRSSHFARNWGRSTYAGNLGRQDCDR